MAGELDFKVGLEDAVSGPAKAAAASLHKLTGELHGAKEGAEHAEKGFFKVVEPAEVARHALEGLSAGFAEVGSSLKTGDVAGAVEGVTEALAGMAQLLDLVVPGLGQAAAAVIKFAGGLAAALVEIAEEGVKTALEVNEVNEKLTATFEALGDKPGAGKTTLDFLNKLSTELPQSRDQLALWTKEFQAFGITDLSELRGQIEATASAQAIGGDEGAQAYLKLAEKIRVATEAHTPLKLAAKSLAQLYKAGINVTDIADRMNISTKLLVAGLKAGTIDAEKFGNALEASLAEKGKGPLEAMGNELGTLKEKFKETWDRLFDGIDTSPITDAIKGIIELGNQAEPSGAALHKGITGALQGIITWMGKVLVEGEVLFLTLELFAVTHKKSLKQVGEAFATVGDAILMVAHAVETLIALASGAPPALLKLLSGLGEGAGSLGAAVATPGAVGGSLLGAGQAPAHAAGGLVGQPAPGEAFASVAPGEMIIPAPIARELSRGNAAPANSNGGGVQIGTLHLTIQAPEDVKDATEVSATGLALALERYQLASGR